MEDSAIVSLYWLRDEKAIVHTAEQYGDSCDVIALRILDNRQDSKVCVNDIYCRAWDTIPPARPKKFRFFGQNHPQSRRRLPAKKFRAKKRRRHGDF